MKRCQSYWCYIPIVLSLALGYLLGGYLTFGVKYLNAFPTLTNETARLILILFGMGMLGGTTYSTRFWSEDINEVVYENEKFLPHIFDFFGYISMIVEAGITGVILYLIIWAGIGITTSAATLPKLNLASSIVIAYCGGLFHFRVIKRLSNIIKKALEEKDDKHKPKKDSTKEDKSPDINC